MNSAVSLELSSKREHESPKFWKYFDKINVGTTQQNTFMSMVLGIVCSVWTKQILPWEIFRENLNFLFCVRLWWFWVAKFLCQIQMKLAAEICQKLAVSRQISPGNSHCLCLILSKILTHLADIMQSSWWDFLERTSWTIERSIIESLYYIERAWIQTRGSESSFLIDQ